MTKETAEKLARGLLEIERSNSDFHFEVDTPENAALLARELEELGCEVHRPTFGTRMKIVRPGGSL